MWLVKYQYVALFLTITVILYASLWITGHREYLTELIPILNETQIGRTIGLRASKGSPRIGNLYDFNNTLPTEAADIQCVPLKSNPITTICVYPPSTDVHISRLLISSGMWEGSQVASFQGYLAKYPEMGVIDVGSNIGVYTLSAAKAGHKVLAIEPNRDNVIRIHKAVSLDNTTKANIKLLRNAIGDARENATLVRNNFNQGGIAINASKSKFQAESDVVNVILMNDMVTYIDFKLAIMKIDVEGFEQRAFAHAEELFAAVDIPVVLMEWGIIKTYLTAPPRELDRIMLKNMIDFLIVRSYKAYTWQNQALQMNQMNQWPWDILWMKNQTFF